MTLKLLIADGQNLVRKGICTLLHQHNPEWELFEAEDGIKAILTTSEINPDLVLMEYDLPKLDGLKASHQISRDFPDMRIILLANRNEPSLIPILTDPNIQGLVLKSADERELFEAIRKVMNGRRHFPVIQLSKATEHSRHKHNGKKNAVNGLPLLTKRESEIFRCLVDGLPVSEITYKLSISRRTIDTHKMNIFRKCNVHSLPALLRFAYRNKLD